MSEKKTKVDAVRAIQQWIVRLSPAQLSPVEDGQPSEASGRVASILCELNDGIADGRMFVTLASEGLRSPVGPVMVLFDSDGAVIAGLGGPESSDRRPDLLRQRFTWP